MRLLFYACALSTLFLLALLLPPTCAPDQPARALRHVAAQQR
jgi:hypothetical protein